MSEVAVKEDAPAPAPDVAKGNLIEIISRVASDPSCDVDKMERLLSMQERLVEREAEIAFNQAMQAAQQEMPVVIRDKTNDQTRSRYAQLETIDRAIRPVITRHGFSLSFGTDESPLDGHYRVTCVVSHIAGHTRHYHADLPADKTGIKGNVNKTDTHAFGSSMSYGRRYLKLLIFDIATGDDDGNKADGGVSPQEEAAPLIDMIDQGATNEEIKAEAKKRKTSPSAFNIARAHYAAKKKREAEINGTA